MVPAASPVIFHSLSFRDAEHCASLFQSWDLQLRQLQPVPFQGKFFRWQTQEFAISRFSNNCKVEIIGAKSSTAFVFANVIEPQDHSNFAHGTLLHPNCIAGFDPWREANLVSSEAGMDLLMVEVDRALLRSLADQAGRHDLDDAFFKQNLITVDPVSMAAYQDYLKQIVYLIDHQPDFLQSPEIIRLLKGSLLPLLINALRQPGKSPKPLRRAAIVMAAQAYMDANLQQPITLAELTAAVCTSRRSLIYGFQDIFGMGPMTYLKQQRLHGARRALLAGHPEHETVANIARTWGFYSLGHFARDYKALFGEAPSETLRQAP